MIFKAICHFQLKNIVCFWFLEEGKMSLNFKVGDFVNLHIDMIKFQMNIYVKTKDIFLERLTLTQALLQTFKDKVFIVTNVKPNFHVKRRTNRPKHLREVFDPTMNTCYVLRESCLILFSRMER